MSDNGIKEGGDAVVVDTPAVMAPNVAMSLHQNGYIKVTFSVGMMANTFFCDGGAARILSGNFAEAADAYDEAWKRLAELAKTAESKDKDEKVTDDPDVLDLFQGDEAAAHEAAVRLAEEGGADSDLN